MREFLISPLYGLFKSFSKPHLKSSTITLILFFLMYGFYMTTEDDAADLYRYLEEIKKTVPLSSVISDILSFEELDLYAPLSISLLSYITSNGHILMAWFGIIYGLFLALSIKAFNDNKGFLDFALVFCFFSVAGVNGLAGVRYSTAFYVFFYGLYMYLGHRKKFGLLLVFSSVLFHFAFALNLLVLLFYMLLNKRPKIVFLILLLSLLISASGIGEVFSFIGSNMGGSADARAASYSEANELYVEALANNQKNANWFIKYQGTLAFIGMVFFSIVLFLKRKKIYISDYTCHFLYFFIILFSFRNIIADIPDLGVRTTGQCFAIACFLVYLVLHDNYNNQLIVKASYLYILSYILIVAYCVRTSFEYVSIFEIVITPIVTFPIKLMITL